MSTGDNYNKKSSKSVGVSVRDNNYVYLPGSNATQQSTKAAAAAAELNLNLKLNHSDDNDFLQPADEKFDIDEFVQQLNLQCNIDNRISECRKSAKRLRELNRIAAAQVVKAVVQHDPSQMIDENCYISSSSPIHQHHHLQNNIVRRHTITTMPPSKAATTTATSTADNQHHHQMMMMPMSPKYAAAPPPQPTIIKQILNNDSKAFAGSLTMPSTPVPGTPMHTSRYNKMINYAGLSSMENNSSDKQQHSTPNSPSFHNTTTLPAIASTTTTPLHQNQSIRNSSTINSLIAASCGSYYNNGGGLQNQNQPNGVGAGSYDFSPYKMNLNDFNTDFYRLCSDTFYCGSETNLVANSFLLPQ
jgi:hypothetical protein